MTRSVESTSRGGERASKRKPGTCKGKQENGEELGIFWRDHAGGTHRMKQ